MISIVLLVLLPIIHSPCRRCTGTAGPSKHEGKVEGDDADFTRGARESIRSVVVVAAKQVGRDDVDADFSRDAQRCCVVVVVVVVVSTMVGVLLITLLSPPLPLRTVVADTKEDGKVKDDTDRTRLAR